MSLLQQCNIGRKLEETCHKIYFARSTGFVDIRDLSDEDVELICRRTLMARNEIKSICKHHHMTYLLKYYLQCKVL